MPSFLSSEEIKEEEINYLRCQT